MPYKGTRRKKHRTHKSDADGIDQGKQSSTQEAAPPPRLVAYHHGPADPSMDELVADWRKVFLPHTFSKLKKHSKNSVKDFIAISVPLGLTHMHIFGSAQHGATLRIGRVPHGPTLLFRVESYTTSRDVISKQKRQYMGGHTQFTTPPLVLLNNFKPSQEEPQVELMTQMLQSMVPPVAVQTTSELNKINRVVLFHHLPQEDGLIEVRHYTVIARSVSLSRAVQKLRDGLLPRSIGTAESISEVLTHDAALSDTDGEGEEVSLPEEVFFKRQQGRCRVKLVELGPRMTLKLLRVEVGLCEGEVIWHRYIEKTPEEVIKTRHAAKKRENMKRQRVKEQEENVARKKDAKGRKIRGRNARGDTGDEDSGPADFDEVHQDNDTLQGY